MLIFILIFQIYCPPNFAGAQLREIEFNEEQLIFFNLTIMVPSNNVNRIQVVKLIIDQLLKIGIRAELVIENLELIALRTVRNFDDPVPLYNNGGFDIYNLGLISSEKFTWKNFGYLNLNLLSSLDKSILGDKNPNHTNYNSSEFQSYMSQYFNEFNTTKRINLFKSIQQQLIDDLPIIGLYTNPLLVMQSSDINLTENIVTALFDQATPSLFANLETSNPDDTITMFFNKNIDLRSIKEIFNPLREINTLLQMIYQPLYETKVGDPLQWEPLLAESLPTWNENHTIAKIELRQDIYFSDGEQLNAYDVNDTYAWYIDNEDMNNIEIAQYNLFSKYLVEENPIRILDNYTLEFTFSQPYVYAMNLFNFGIIPSHVLGMSEYPIQQSIEDTIFNALLENGTTDLLLGTGPFKFKSFEYTNSNVTLNFVKNPTYWGGEVKTTNIEFINFFPRSNFPELVSSGEIDLAVIRGAFPPTRFNISKFDVLGNISYFQIPESFIQLLGLNLLHPVFGNGSLTPLGLEDPSRAGEAAKYVRKAMNTVIPRDQIITDILSANNEDTKHFKPAYSHQFPTVYGYFENTSLYTYNLSKAKFFMENAGYIFPTAVSNTIQPNNTNTTDKSLYPIETILLLIPVILIRRLKLSHTRKYEFSREGQI